MEAFNKYLQQFPNYTPSVFDKAYPYLSYQDLVPNEYLLREGNVCKNIAFIKKGILRLYYLNDGKEVTNCFCVEGTISTSYRSLVNQCASEIAIQAIEKSELIILPYTALQLLYKQDSFWQQLGRLAVENELFIAESHRRFIRDFSATERYLHILENNNGLLQRVPLNHLATYLQVAPETLSRIRKKISRT